MSPAIPRPAKDSIPSKIQRKCKGFLGKYKTNYKGNARGFERKAKYKGHAKDKGNAKAKAVHVTTRFPEWEWWEQCLSYNMKYAYISGGFRNLLAKKSTTEKRYKTIIKQMISAWPKKAAPNPNTVDPKTL